MQRHRMLHSSPLHSLDPRLMCLGYRLPSYLGSRRDHLPPLPTQSLAPCIDPEAYGEQWSKEEEGTQVLRTSRGIQLTALPSDGTGLDK